ncbi:hypothetical protein GCM10020000_13100 [Streptomyces olivoverticillatus]
MSSTTAVWRPPDAERVLGMHLNSLPFPTVRPSGTWRELVERVYAQEAEIWTHRRYPLPAIQRDAGEGDRLVQVLFEHQNFHQVDEDDVDIDATLNSSPNEFALSAVARGGYINLGTSTSVISRANLERLASMYRSVLEAMAADAAGDASAARLPDGELERLVSEWNATTEFPVDECVHEVFAAQAARTPESVAVTCGDGALTYAEVNERANRLAHHLRALGAGPEALVGVSLERGIDLVPTLLGVLKSGAAYLPLDPVNPDDRLAYIVGDASAPIVVTQTALAGRVGGFFDGELVVVDGERDAAAIAARPGTDPEPLTGPDGMVYVIYTSGSTGKPKGVSLTHANVLRHFSATAGQLGFSETDVVTQSHSYAFDVSVWEMWGALLHGGRLVIVPNEISRSPHDFLDLLVDEQVTVLLQTPPPRSASWPPWPVTATRASTGSVCGWCASVAKSWSPRTSGRGWRGWVSTSPPCSTSTGPPRRPCTRPIAVSPPTTSTGPGGATSASPFATCASTSWTPTATWCRWVYPVRSALVARPWPVAI